MKIKTPFTELLGIDLPIIGAPMFLVSNVAMVTEVSNAGGIGVFPTLNFRSTELLDEALTEMRAKTDKPIGANLTILYNPRIKEDFKVLLKHKVELIITSLGNPTVVIEQCRGTGTKVFCDVINLRHAQKVKAAGGDGLVAVSYGAGGHAGFVAQNVLIPYLKEKTGLPVIAAGGMASGQTMAAALSLGADAVYLGTRLIASTEAQVDPQYKKLIVEGEVEDIVNTDAVTGHPCNFLKYSLDRWKKKEANLSNWKDIWSAGQTVGLVDDVKPCKEIIAKVVKGYQSTVQGLSLTISGI